LTRNDKDPKIKDERRCLGRTTLSAFFLNYPPTQLYIPIPLMLATPMFAHVSSVRLCICCSVFFWGGQEPTVPNGRQWSPTGPDHWCMGGSNWLVNPLGGPNQGGGVLQISYKVPRKDSKNNTNFELKSKKKKGGLPFYLPLP
jgi:hypothetical protein